MSAIKLLIFVHSCQIVIHLCYAWKALFQFLNLGFLSHSIRIRNRIHFLVQIWRNKKSNPRTAIVDVERKALQCCSKHAMGETESHIDTSKTKLIVSNLRPIKLSTLFSHELLTFIFVSRHFRSHHPNKACLFLKRIVTS